MDKRLGKCFCAIRHSHWHGARWNLIVCPVSAYADWMDELEADGRTAVSLIKGSFDERQDIFRDAVQQHHAGTHPMFFVINPDGLFRSKGRQPKITCRECGGSGKQDDHYADLPPICPGCKGKGETKDPRAMPGISEIALFPWDEVIWDESTNLRNTKSQVYEVARTSFGDCPRRLILSGEYAPEGAEDVFGQMRYLLGRFMGHTNFFAWRDAYFEKVGYDWLPKKGTMRMIREAIAPHAVILSRNAAGLPVIRHFERRVVEMPAHIRRVYDHCEKNFELPADLLEKMEDPTKGVTGYAVVVRNWLNQLAGGYPKHLPSLNSHHKMKALVGMVTGEFAREPLVITFRYNTELYHAVANLRENGVSCEPVTGNTKPDARRTLQHEFRARKVRVLCMQTRVAKFGIDLSTADTMIRYSLPDPYEEISQPMDRIVHPLKKKPLAYIDLITEDTTDEDKWEAMQDKHVTARTFMTSLDRAFKRRMVRKYGKVPEKANA